MIHLATRRMVLSIVAMAATAGLVSGCGFKGDLYMPPPGTNTPSSAPPPPATVPAPGALPSSGTTPAQNSTSTIPDDTPASSAQSPL